MYLPSHIPEKSKRIQFFEIFVAFMLVSATMIFIGVVAFFVLFPTFPNLVGSIFPTCSIWVICWTFAHIYFALICSFQVLFILVCAAIYGIVLMPVVTHEFHLNSKSYASTTSLREPVNLTTAYRANQIFHNKLNNCLGNILFPIQTMSTLLFIFSSYMLIRLRAEMGPLQISVLSVLAIGGSTIWSIVLEIFGYINYNGNKVLASWKRTDWKNKWEWKFMAKFRVSCRPIMICWGKTYIIRMVSLLVYLRGLTRGLVRTLLALDKGMNV